MPSEENVDALAQELYEVYVDDADGLNFQGDPCPDWDDLPVAIQDHWDAVAVRVIEKIVAARQNSGY